ncbi:U1 small nuclear ribonucleoprotein of 70kDa MW N terminal-domain-containing protein [Parachaetomium inaequale]|uniref:U1 small nuclear ribonucleoprotein of 70kDa MW N terminal-domain-containing protein n=1 Tax=Parachaetomium inaequale TaxID=2588326 RepID=A0AAN6PR93_9PEZI|nr:U1 small nuclear ribonucleoprotein of 70kDa MW N terminal-domain-containing protein [Parachaetomium inaequale]
MTDRLPPNLLALFAPRPPLRWVPPSDHAPEQRRTAAVSGVAQFLPALAEYEREYEYHPTESWLEARDRKKREKAQQVEEAVTEGPKNYSPHDDPNIRGDAFKTLIVARLDYSADEKDLEREFGRFGPIERIRIIRDTHAHEKGNKKQKPHRGYGFVVFEREKDMRGNAATLILTLAIPPLAGTHPRTSMALKLASPPSSSPFRIWRVRELAALDGCDGIRIKDRRIKVDVERGRTVKGWKPRRLGGGLGGRGYTKASMARPMGPGGFGGGGFRGGFGGGFRGRDRGGFRGGGGGFGDRGGFRSGPAGPGGGGGYGNRDRGFGGPPNAPSGPGGGGYGGRDNRRDGPGGGGGGGYGRDGGGSRSYDDRSGGGGYRERNPRQSGSNMEPIRPRGGENGGGHYSSGGGGSGGRDYDRPRDHDDSRKRGYDGGYEDPRKLRRY